MEGKRHPVSTRPMSTASARGLYSNAPAPTGPQTVAAAATWCGQPAEQRGPSRGSLTSIMQGAASKAARRSPGSQASSCFLPKELPLEWRTLPSLLLAGSRQAGLPRE